MRNSILAVGTALVLAATVWAERAARAETITCSQTGTSACLTVTGNGAHGSAITGYVSGTGPDVFGVYGQSGAGLPGAGVYGQDTSNGYGVYGTTQSGWGVYGYSNGSLGVAGESSTSDGVQGYSSSGNGTSGYGNSGYGVYGTSSSNIGVVGESTSYAAIWGFGQLSNGVVGQNGRTDWNAAAISALPGNTNGLAVYAGGGVEKPGGGAWSSTSDARVKKDVKDFRAGLAELEKVHTVTYRYNGLGGTMDDGHEFVGVIAQELEKVMPDMVQSRRVKLHPNDAAEIDLKRVDPSAFTYVLINAVQEQQKVIEQQNARIARLEAASHPALLSSLVPGNLGFAALGIVPLGLVAARRKRKNGDAA